MSCSFLRKPVVEFQIHDIQASLDTVQYSLVSHASHTCDASLGLDVRNSEFGSVLLFHKDPNR